MVGITIAIFFCRSAVLLSYVESLMEPDSYVPKHIEFTPGPTQNRCVLERNHLISVDPKPQRFWKQMGAVEGWWTKDDR